MKNPSFIASVLMLTGAFIWGGCSTSTTAPATTSSGSLSVPTSIDFGNTRLGVCADPILGVPRDSIVTIQNTGTDTLRIHSAALQSSEFTLVSLDSVIPPSGSGPMKLQFCPSALNSTSSTLLITSNATEDSSLTIALTGNGVPYYPGFGSEYTYSAVALNAEGKPTGAPAFTVVNNITATNLTYQGQSNVLEYSNTVDSTFYLIDNDGDVSVYTTGFSIWPSSLFVGAGWQTLPYTTHTQNVYTFAPQTYTDSLGIQVTVSISDTASYVGPATVTIDGIPITESHVHSVESGLYTSDKGTRSFVTTVENYFSPELGILVSQTKYLTEIETVFPSKTGETPTGSGTQVNLTSFKAQ
jgi:hypothetical protein